MADDDLTIAVLREIRDEVRGVREAQTKTNTRLDGVVAEVRGLGERLDGVVEGVQGLGQRLDTVESTLLDIAEQQRFVVRYTKALAERDFRLERRVDDLEVRVGKLESE